MRLAAFTPTVAAAVALLTGCMGGDVPQYDPASYRSGDCRSAAAPVFRIDAAIGPVLDDGRAPRDAAGALKRSQEALIRSIPDFSDAGLKVAAQEVVDAVGFYRIGVDADNFTPELAREVRAASTSLLTRCSTDVDAE